MKNPIRVVGSSVLVLCLVTSVIQAAEPAASRYPQPSLPSACQGTLGQCWDDYCRQPLPQMPCAIGIWAGEHYCRKPLPGVQSWSGQTGCDTYQRKPKPALNWSVTPGSRCVATSLKSGMDSRTAVGPSKSHKDMDTSALSLAFPTPDVSAAAAADSDTRPGRVSPPDFSSRRRVASESGDSSRILR